MAITTPTNVDTSIPEIWSRLTLRDHLYEGFWGGQIGDEGSRSAIIRRSELVGAAGDLIHIQVTSPLAGAGVQGDTTTLEGAEEALTTSEIKCAPDLYRHAVRVYRRANKKSILDLRQEARRRLAEWGGEKMDDVRFANFTSNAPVAGTGEVQGAATTPNVHKVGGGAAAPTTLWVNGDFDDIGAADTLTVAELQKIRLKLFNQRALPLRVDGHPFFAIVVHPNCLFDLKREAEYRDWVREAHVRGESNPFFRGATAIIDGTIIFEHVNVPTRTNVVPAIKVAQNIAYGAEAFVEALDEATSWAEDTFDYGNQFGIAYSFAFQPRRGLNKNSLQVWAAAVDK